MSVFCSACEAYVSEAHMEACRIVGCPKSHEETHDDHIFPEPAEPVTFSDLLDQEGAVGLVTHGVILPHLDLGDCARLAKVNHQCRALILGTKQPKRIRHTPSIDDHRSKKSFRVPRYDCQAIFPYGCNAKLVVFNRSYLEGHNTTNSFVIIDTETGDRKLVTGRNFKMLRHLLQRDSKVYALRDGIIVSTRTNVRIARGQPQVDADVFTVCRGKPPNLVIKFKVLPSCPDYSYILPTQNEWALCTTTTDSGELIVVHDLNTLEERDKIPMQIQQKIDRMDVCCAGGNECLLCNCLINPPHIDKDALAEFTRYRLAIFDLVRREFTETRDIEQDDFKSYEHFKVSPCRAYCAVADQNKVIVYCLHSSIEPISVCQLSEFWAVTETDLFDTYNCISDISFSDRKLFVKITSNHCETFHYRDTFYYVVEWEESFSDAFVVRSSRHNMIPYNPPGYEDGPMPPPPPDEGEHEGE
jgi:hypothetical protein